MTDQKQDLNQVYHELGVLTGATKSLGRSVDAVTQALKDHAGAETERSEKIYKLIEKHDARLQGLEQWRAWTRGIFVVVAMSVAVGAGWLRLFRGSGGPPT